MPTFDIVSHTDLPEVDNALNGMRREITQRFDFKNSKCTIERADETITIVADDEFKLRQMHDLLTTYLTRRQVDAGALDHQSPTNPRKSFSRSRTASSRFRCRSRAINCGSAAKNATICRPPSPW
jgi:uncharacterized protein YajQ (UPF0234 family)